MPSFFTKVFGRKKDEKEPAAHSHKRHSQPSLLEGKYEAVSPNVSPSATHFSEPSSHLQHPAKDSPHSFQRSRSRLIPDQSRQSNVSSTPAPHLTLNLPVPKEEKSRALGVVFEADPEKINSLPEELVGERRLNPLEALLLVKACSTAIIDKGGLESLGLMHPHWYSASPEVQRKLISLFILSLGPKSPITTLSPSSAFPSAMFETELNYTRDPHDIASVLRWGLRHLRLEGSSFGSRGSTNSEWEWYASFASSERDGGYPTTAFSKSLVPLLPPAHTQLLGAILDTMSSLAAHAETMGTSGSKLAKLFGLWLLSTERVKSSENWATFYERWERAGRILEHLFLAHVREEAVANRMPLRLAELVKQYPYLASHEKDTLNSADDLPYLPIPRFSTRRRDAVFIRIDSLLPSPNSTRPARGHPLRLLSEALKTSPEAGAFASEQAQSLWEEIKTKASEDAENTNPYPALSRILDDETLRLLSLIPAGTLNPSAPSSPFSTISSPSSPALLAPESTRVRSASVGTPTGNGTETSLNGHGKAPTTSSLTNWSDFSTAGFGESAFDKNLALSIADDVEVTKPSRTVSQAKTAMRGRRSSVDNPITYTSTTDSDAKLKSTLSRVELIEVDEAFFDFWSDALLDPIAASWPAFVVCQLKGVQTSLLVVEQTYTLPAPPSPPPTTQQEPTTRRAASPRPSVAASVGSGRKSFSFSPTIKRFSFFSHNEGGSKTTAKKSSSNAKPAPRTPRIGEMGEILAEEEEPAVTRVQTAPAAAVGKPVPSLPAKKASPELPAVPLVDAPPPPGEAAPVATEAVKTEGETPEKPTAVVSEELTVPKDETPVGEATETEKELPAAPEGVVLGGSTPGPQVALESSEVKTLVEAQEATHVVEKPAEASDPEVTPSQEQATAKPEVAPPVPEKEEAAAPVEEAIPEAAKEPERVEDATVPQEPQHVEEPTAAVTLAETEVAPQEHEPFEEPTVTEQIPKTNPTVHDVAPPTSDAVAEPAAAQNEEPELKEEKEPAVAQTQAIEEQSVSIQTGPTAEPSEPAAAAAETATTPAEDSSAPVIEENSASEAKDSSHANGASHASETSESTIVGDPSDPESHPAEEPKA